jgi:RES domain-containing protein
MTVYRVAKPEHANDLSGDGARIMGGRWNHTGTACLYASASRALSLLEFSVHLTKLTLPKIISIISIHIPAIPQTTIKKENLPNHWDAYPFPSTTMDFGNLLLRQNEYAIIEIPSAIIPDEFNYIINPIHPLSNTCRIINITNITYEPRIKNKF